MTRTTTACRRWMWAMALVAATGCSPTLDWRDVRPEDSGCEALFPCRPSSQTRRVPLAGATVALTLLACEAGGATYALAFADVGETSRVAPALAQLAASALRNVGAPDGAAASAPARIAGPPGGSPAQRLTFAGQTPDGAPVRGQALLFSRGSRVLQATVLGAKPPADAIDTFFDALRLPP